MRKSTEFKFNVSEFEDYDWLYVSSGDDDENIYPVRGNYKDAAEFYKVSPEFIEQIDSTIREMADKIIAAFKEDLEDLYNLVGVEE